MDMSTKYSRPIISDYFVPQMYLYLCCPWPWPIHSGLIVPMWYLISSLELKQSLTSLCSPPYLFRFLLIPFQSFLFGSCDIPQPVLDHSFVSYSRSDIDADCERNLHCIICTLYRFRTCYGIVLTQSLGYRGFSFYIYTIPSNLEWTVWPMPGWALHHVF